MPVALNWLRLYAPLVDGGPATGVAQCRNEGRERREQDGFRKETPPPERSSRNGHQCLLIAVACSTRGGSTVPVTSALRRPADHPAVLDGDPISVSVQPDPPIHPDLLLLAGSKLLVHSLRTPEAVHKLLG